MWNFGPIKQLIHFLLQWDLDHRVFSNVLLAGFASILVFCSFSKSLFLKTGLFLVNARKHSVQKYPHQKLSCNNCVLNPCCFCVFLCRMAFTHSHAIFQCKQGTSLHAFSRLTHCAVSPFLRFAVTLGFNYS
jgi:hypothetical protein